MRSHDQRSLGNLVNGLSNVVHVVWSERHHGDATILGQEDGKLVLEPLHLLLSEARVAEHSYLLCDVRPVAGGTWRSYSRSETYPPILY